jgi:hypothetical protein
LIVAIAGLLSAIAVISTWVFNADKLYKSDFQWQRSTANLLESLHAGYSLPFFTQQLGVPAIVHSTSRGYLESIYQGRGFWVEALTKDNSEVKFFSVTVCNRSITPKFDMPGVGVVTLNESTLKSVTPSAQYDYWFGGLGGWDSPTMKEFDYGGFQGGYRTFMWGLSSACNESVNEMLSLQRTYPDLGFKKLSNHELSLIRNRAVTNLYGETAPEVLITDLPNDPEELGVNPTAVNLAESFFGNGRIARGTMKSCNVSGERSPATILRSCGEL